MLKRHLEREHAHRQPDGQRDEREPEPRREERRRHAPRAPPERDADADLARALPDGERDERVEPDRREPERERADRRRPAGDLQRLPPARAGEVGEGAEAPDRQLRRLRAHEPPLVPALRVRTSSASSRQRAPSAVNTRVPLPRVVARVASNTPTTTIGRASRSRPARQSALASRRPTGSAAPKSERARSLPITIAISRPAVSAGAGARPRRIGTSSSAK
jgi:hypothetical protein